MTLIKITDGPSREKLILALSDTEMGLRRVKIRLATNPHQDYSIEIFGLTRLDPRACE